MRYVLTAFACAVVTGLTAYTVLDGGSQAVDPPAVQLADDGHTKQGAAGPARAHRDRGRNDRATRARADAEEGGTGNRPVVVSSSPAPAQPSATTSSSPGAATSRETPITATAAAATSPTVTSDGGDDYGSEDDSGGDD
jgi:hypothetical protein